MAKKATKSAKKTKKPSNGKAAKRNPTRAATNATSADQIGASMKALYRSNFLKRSR